MSDLTGRFIHMQFEPLSFDEIVAARLAEAREARQAVVVDPEVSENTVRIIAQGNLHDEREYGVDGERERAVEAGEIDALEAGEGDARFDDLILALDPNGGTRVGDAIARILESLGPLAEDLVIIDMAAEQNIMAHELPGRAYVNRLIDADMNRLIIDEFGSIPDKLIELDPIDLVSPLHSHRARESFLWGERGKRVHVIDDLLDLRDPFINAVIGHEEPNDQRKGFYREFEGKRRDGSYKRPKRGKRRG